MPTIKDLHNIIDTLNLNDQDKEYLAVKDIVEPFNLQGRWKVWKFLDYLAGLVSYHLCQHGITSKKQLAEEDLYNKTKYETETCHKCGMERLVCLNEEIIYGEKDIKITYCAWKLPKEENEKD